MHVIVLFISNGCIFFVHKNCNLTRPTIVIFGLSKNTVKHIRNIRKTLMDLKRLKERRSSGNKSVKFYSLHCCCRRHSSKQSDVL